MAKNEFIQKLMLAPLYERIDISSEVKENIDSYISYDSEIEYDSIDLYCVECQQHSIFTPKNIGQLTNEYRNHYTDGSAFLKGYLPFGVISFECSRNKSHIAMMLIECIEDSIIKIGQYPAKADMDSPDWNRFSKIIPNKYLLDIKKAIGLATHGIGAGSYVYLRRVMEYLINEAYEGALMNEDISEDDYQKARITEKIVLLKEYLPKILVDNKEAYSILSKGVHELDENDCLDHFGLLSTTIELILDEMLSKKKQKEKEKSLKAGISKLHSQLKAKE